MKKSMKIIFIVILILIITVSIILFALKKESRENKKIAKEENINGNEFEIEVNKDLSEVDSKQEFFDVNECIQYYIDYLKDDNNDAVSKVLDNKYKENNNVDIKELKKYLIDINDSKNEFIALKMNKIDKDTDKSIYFVSGKLLDEESKEEKESEYTVILDNSQDVFSIIPENLEEKTDYEYNLDIEDDTEDFYNEYTSVDISDKEILLKYFDYYKKLSIVSAKESFNLLDDEYKNKKFSNNEEKYLEYLSKIDIQNIDIDKYLVNYYDEYTEYIAKNDDDSYYIFKETGPMKFTLILDTYTIDLKQFTDKYNSGDEQVKVGMNTEKIIEALNLKDYEYVYGKLDETFKNNNFNNINNFENYINDNLYEHNDIEYEEFSAQSGVYIYNAKIKDSNDENSEEKKITIIMKLLSGTDYVFSFSIE